MDYYIDGGSSWTEALNALIKHGTILSRSCGQDADSFANSLYAYCQEDDDRYPEYHIYKGHTFLVLEHEEGFCDDYGDPYFLVKMVKTDSNQAAKPLLDAEY